MSRERLLARGKAILGGGLVRVRVQVRFGFLLVRRASRLASGLRERLQGGRVQERVSGRVAVLVCRRVSHGRAVSGGRQRRRERELERRQHVR